jgi:hypothetical protein
MTYSEVKSNLSIYIDERLVEDLLKHYRELKRFQFVDAEKTGLNCAKFCETALKTLIYITKRKVVGKINVGRTIIELEKLPGSSFNDSIRIFIPRNARIVYDIRNRRGIAHSGGIKPNYIDTNLGVSICDWILSELLRIYHDSDEDKIKEIIMEITERKVPLIERFGEDLIILEKNLSFKEEILLILYYSYPRMTSNKDLGIWLKPGYSQLITSNLGKLESDKLVYRKNRESVLTKKGLKYVEENFNEYLTGGVT